MIKKLRIRFIIISMVSVFLVLFVTMGAINVSNYVVVHNGVTNALTEIIRQGTKEPGEGGPGDKKQTSKVELRQEHYFIVSFNNDGTIKETNDKHTFMLSLEECNELATKVYKDELTGGRYNTLRYKKAVKEDGLTYIAFIDIKDKINNYLNFFVLSYLISIGAYLVFFALIVIASRIAYKPSEEAYKNQKRFITNASHELKTPLTIISADMDLIEMDNGKTEWSDSIRDQIRRLNEMTNQLVTLSKLEEDDPKRFPFADFSLNDVFENAVNAFTPAFEKEGIKFSSNISGNITMFANQNMIEQLIYIFLANSVKYTGGDNKSSYFVATENNKGKVELRFSNTISQDDEVDVKQIFDRFYRSPSNKKEGSGVGLSIAKEIAKLHKGTIKADKNANTISFLVTLNK